MIVRRHCISAITKEIHHCWLICIIIVVYATRFVIVKKSFRSILDVSWMFRWFNTLLLWLCLHSPTSIEISTTSGAVYLWLLLCYHHCFHWISWVFLAFTHTIRIRTTTITMRIIYLLLLLLLCCCRSLMLGNWWCGTTDARHVVMAVFIVVVVVVVVVSGVRALWRSIVW